MQWGNPQITKVGIPKIKGNQRPSLACITDTVIMKPHKIAPPNTFGNGVQ